jgi:CRISPR system Cascade subunit CasB
MTSATTRQQAFVAALEDLAARGDRAALAALRRGLGKPPGQVPEMDRHVVPWLPGDQPFRDDEAYYLVASLFAAWHQGGQGVRPFKGTLGLSLHALAERAPNHAAGVERRFTALLASHRDELPTHLRHSISLLRTHGVPADWARLLSDLSRWDHPDRIVQRRWARDFWRTDAQPAEPEGTITSNLETEQA